MGDFFVWAMDHLGRQWSMILRVWPSFMLMAILVGGGVWYATSKYYEAHYEETLRTTEQRRAYAQDQVDQLQSQAGKSSQHARPYTISKEDEADFIQTLASAERHDVEIRYVNGDKKALALANRIADLLELSNWSVPQLNTTVIGGSPPTGVIIQISKENDIPRGVALLQALLKKHNIETHIQKDNPGEGSPPVLKIYVGPDPQDPPSS